jgi:hypothetical protein
MALKPSQAKPSQAKPRAQIEDEVFPARQQGRLQANMPRRAECSSRQIEKAGHFFFSFD